MRSIQRGFTLLELLVVLAIGALMIAVVAPKITSGVSSSELKGAARHLAASLRHVRSYAISRQEEATLDLDVEAKTYKVSGIDRTFELPQKENLEIKLVTATSEKTGENVGSVRFFPDGTSTGGRISLAPEGEEHLGYEVDVDWFTGRIRILD